MLTIRLARAGNRNNPFYRVVLTEHTKPVGSGYTEVLGFHDPLNHKTEIDTTRVKELVAKGVTLSSRVAKMAYNLSKDETYQKFIKFSTVQKAPRKEK